MIDPVRNFAIITPSSLHDSDDTLIPIVTGDVSKLPSVNSEGAFNLVWWNNTDYSAPHEDPEVEIVRVTAIGVNTITVTRGQENTVASIKNRSGKTYRFALIATKKTIDDIRDELGGKQAQSDNLDALADLDTAGFVKRNSDGSFETVADAGVDTEQVQDIVAGMIKDGTGLAWSYNDATGELTPTVSLTPFSTSNLSEGSNLYYTNARADARITAQKGQANGIATLGSDGKIPTSQLPALAISNTFVVNSQSSMLALSAETGDVAVRTDLNKSFILTADTPSNLSSWQELLTPTDSVLSVNGQTGAITLTTSHITEGSNLYFTNERVDDRVASLIQNGTGITWAYDDVAGTLTPTVTVNANPAGSNGQIQFNDDGDFGASGYFNVNKDTGRIGIQVTSPLATIHAYSNIGSTLLPVVTGSISLVDEVLPTVPTITAVAIPEPVAGTSSTFSFVPDGGAFTANNTTHYFRIYRCLKDSITGFYYKSSLYETISNTDDNSGNSFDFSLSLATFSISGEEVGYYVEYSTDDSSYSPIGVYDTNSFTISSLSGSDPTLAWGTYTSTSGATANPPTGLTGNYYDGMSYLIQDPNYSAFYADGKQWEIEVDSYKEISGTKYVSGTPTTTTFTDDNSTSYYGLNLAWTSGGTQDGYIIRTRYYDGSNYSSWVYQYVSSESFIEQGSTNDTDAESRWGQTYSGGGSTTFTFRGYGKGSGVYSATYDEYSVTISDSQKYIIKHTTDVNAKILGEVNAGIAYGQDIATVYYDRHYTQWGYGTVVTPNTTGFTGTQLNRDYRIYSYSTGSAIYSDTYLQLSVTTTSGSKTVSGTFTVPAGASYVKILRQVNGGGYTHQKTITSGNTFTDDVNDNAWTTSPLAVTPNTIKPITGRFDKEVVNITDLPVLAVINTGSGQFAKLSFGYATDSTVDPSLSAHITVARSTGYMTLTSGRVQISTSLGGTPIIEMGSNGFLGNANLGSSQHFQWYSQNNTNMVFIRSDRDTAYFGAVSNSDEQNTVTIGKRTGGDHALILAPVSSSDGGYALLISANGSYQGGIASNGRGFFGKTSVGNGVVSIGGTSNSGQLLFDTHGTTTAVNGAIDYQSNNWFGADSGVRRRFARMASTTAGVNGNSAVYDANGFLVSTNGIATSRLFAQTATGTVANTTTETSIDSTGVGSKTLPANFFVAGKSIRISGKGIHSAVSNPTIRIRIKLGSTTVLDTTAVASKNSTNDSFTIDAIISCRTTGASGTIFGQGTFIEAGSGHLVFGMANTTTATINTTATQAITVTAQWGTANASNTISLSNLVIEEI